MLTVWNPVLHFSHISAPSAAHLAPVDGTPLGHEHLLASHLVLSRLAFQPVLHADTRHPDEYALAFATSQATDGDADTIVLKLINSIGAIMCKQTKNTEMTKRKINL